MKKEKNNIILETRNLSIGYRDKKKNHVVQSEIKLKINRGELVAVLGKNGIGKSTLLRTLTKVQSPLEGQVLIDGKELKISNLSELSKKLSVVLTERLPDSQLTVFELVALGRQPYTNWIGKLTQEDIDQVNWSLEQTETSEFASKHFYELSDGQLQRVMIARAMAQDTDIIILDEPTAHLDMHHTIKIFELLKKLAVESGKAVVLSSHQVNLAIKYAEQLILMTEKEVLSGTGSDLIRSKSLDKLFPTEIIKFNTDLEQFVINK